MKTITTILLVGCLSINSYSQTLTSGEVINKAGFQRTLSIRMAKDYLSIGANIRTDEATKELDEASTLFNENYNDLVLYAKNDETKKALENVDALWKSFRVKVLSTPNAEDGASVIMEANNLTIASNNVVEKLIASSNSKKGVLVSISGRQRTFAQKIAMLYIAKFWQVPYRNLDADLETAINDFQNALMTLTSSKDNTEEINTALKLQVTEWEFLKIMLNAKSENLMPAQIFSSTNLLMKNAIRVTKLYDKLVL